MLVLKFLFFFFEHFRKRPEIFHVWWLSRKKKSLTIKTRFSQKNLFLFGLKLGNKVRHKQTLQPFAVPMIYNMASFYERVNYPSAFEVTYLWPPSLLFGKKSPILWKWFLKLELGYKSKWIFLFQMHKRLI